MAATFFGGPFDGVVASSDWINRVSELHNTAGVLIVNLKSPEITDRIASGEISKEEGFRLANNFYAYTRHRKPDGSVEFHPSTNAELLGELV